MSFRIAAFCTLTGYSAVAKTTHIEPVTFPPLTMQTFDPQDLTGFDILYFHLHGIAGQAFWYGDGLITAISADQIKSVDLHGTRAAFVANCFGAGSQMVRALISAGVQAVIAGPGKNYTVENEVRGADLLGQHFIEAVVSGYPDEQALAIAKSKIKFRAIFSPIERDALDFQLYQ